MFYLLGKKKIIFIQLMVHHDWAIIFHLGLQKEFGGSELFGQKRPAHVQEPRSLKKKIVSLAVNLSEDFEKGI